MLLGDYSVFNLFAYGDFDTEFFFFVSELLKLVTDMDLIPVGFLRRRFFFDFLL